MLRLSCFLSPKRFGLSDIVLWDVMIAMSGLLGGPDDEWSVLVTDDELLIWVPDT